MQVYCLLFEDYETLDLMGPVEMLARVPDAALYYVSRAGGLVASRQGFAVATKALQTLPENSILLVPGGQGTRALVRDEGFLSWLGARVDEAETCLAVCTGSALLAACGRLDGLRALPTRRPLPGCKAWERRSSGKRWRAGYVMASFIRLPACQQAWTWRLALSPIATGVRWPGRLPCMSNMPGRTMPAVIPSHGFTATTEGALRLSCRFFQSSFQGTYP